jgi:hypothetical protein
VKYIKSIVEIKDPVWKHELFSSQSGENTMLDICCVHEIEMKANNINYPFKHRDVLIFILYVYYY